MSKVQFTRVDISEWDHDNVELVQTGDNINILYDGKVPTLKIIGPRGKDAYMLESKKGLAKNDVYDNTTKKYIKGEWDGTWGLSFKLTDSLSSIKPPAEGEEDKRSDVDKLRWKVIELKETLAANIRELTGKPTGDVISYKNVEEEVTKVVGKKEVKQKIKKRDENGYAYVGVKVGYIAPDDAPTFKDNRGKDVAEFEYRSPKGKYYDTARAKGKMQVADPAKECAVPMRSALDATIYTTFAHGKYNVHFNLLNLYYEEDQSLAEDSSNGVDDVLDRLGSERELMDSIPV